MILTTIEMDRSADMEVPFFMARPRHEQPTPAELEILKILWQRGEPASVRDVFEIVNQSAQPQRAYTSVMSLLNVMTDKGLLRRSPFGRAFLYDPVSPREQTLRSMLGETLERVYNGSASLLVAHLLDQSHPSGDELDQIRSLLDEYQDRGSRPSPKGGIGFKPLRSKRSRS
jgi:BlaI family transcriptional regulator, penicillinase repressor